MAETIWLVAFEAARGRYDAPSTFAAGAEWAVGWVIALVGMGESIRRREGERNAHAEWAKGWIGRAQ